MTPVVNEVMTPVVNEPGGYDTDFTSDTVLILQGVRYRFHDPYASNLRNLGLLRDFEDVLGAGSQDAERQEA